MVASPRESQRSYYDASMVLGKPMIRARRPSVVKNALTGSAIVGFAAAANASTIRADAQDNFEHVKVPDVPVQRAKTSSQITSGPLAK
ncbi:hypothetical protein FN846DRAFT_975701 [Sphaerosporella brunnea]|uniref:Uncharacterized protein n=1 Tax=Sphaerosporella brunnea TaxID=1250544 RepID=A0A5J5EES5_9PEZI|nr:hypothetical protein FN846DRAFT_975701 [Sphaerosporella brunnea]